MIHTSGKVIATYYRKSNKHNWELGILADGPKTLARALYLNQKDFPGYQHGFIEYNANGSVELDNLPKNAEITIFDHNLNDPIVIDAVNRFILSGATSINPKIFAVLVELGFLGQTE